MREHLIRYLLGELDADERRDLQSRLKSSPELRAELEQLRSCFASSQDEDLFAPDAPTGLAARTAGLVSSGEIAGDSLKSREGGMSHAGDGPAGLLGWSLADLTVAGGVMLAVSMLIFPALRNSRDGTRRTVCQDHQRQMWFLVTEFANNNGGQIPKVGPNDNAGSFVIQLLRGDYIPSGDLANLLVCPGAPRARGFTIMLPSAQAIRAMSSAQLAHESAKASPFYNYRLPYRVGGNYYYVQNDHRTMSPVLSDASGDNQTDPMSPNHCGRLVQVQFADGSLRSLTSVTLPGLNDDMYRNDLGRVAAGLRPLDAVLGPSNATPGDDGFDKISN
jgi:hypothetical protein